MKMQFHLIIILLCFYVVSAYELEDIKTSLTVVNPKVVVETKLYNLNKIKSFNSEKLIAFKNEFFKISSNFGNDSKPINSTLCLNSLKQLGEDLKNGYQYSLKVVDSWGGPESGILQGNTHWYGRYTECLDSKNGTYFTPKYYNIIYMQGSYPLFQAGVCFPKECSADELNYYIINYIPIKNVYVIDVPIKISEWRSKDIAAITLSSILLFFVIVSTIYDFIIRMRQKKNVAYKNLLDDNEPKIQPLSASQRFCTSFSLIKNTELLLDTTQKPGQIHCLHGIRFLSMAWVVLGHSQLFCMSYIDNTTYLLKYALTHWTYQVISNGTFSVDTFFFLSGLLVAYLGMREVEKKEGRFNPLWMYFLRFMRLTPAYAFCIFFSVTLWEKMGEGPLFIYIAKGLENGCAKYWWSSLLYINNLYPASMNEECYAWGWYLANDMQFYILSPLFLYLLYKSPLVGTISTSFIIFVSVLLTGIFSSITSQQPQSVSMGQSAFQSINSLGGGALPFTPNVTSSDSQYIQDIYAKPYIRIGAYLVGILTGYILHKRRDKRILMPKVVVGFGWLISTALSLSIIFGLYPKVKEGQALSVNVAALYNAISRPLWCVSLAWITIACVNGYGGYVNKLLSLKIFMPLSKLTYSSYLLHPLVLWYTYASVEETMHVSMFKMVVLYIGQLVLTHLFAYIIAMVVEFPASTLVKLLSETLRSSASHTRKDPPTHTSVQDQLHANTDEPDSTDA